MATTVRARLVIGVERDPAYKNGLSQWLWEHHAGYGQCCRCRRRCHLYRTEGELLCYGCSQIARRELAADD